jgi:alpha-tubulin suppressor-like RCC1 family protein
MVLALKETSIQRVACGQSQTIVLAANGQVFAFGWNERQQIGTTDQEDVILPKHLDAISKYTIVDLAVGKFQSLFLDDKGQLHIFGWKEPYNMISKPQFAQIACGENHCIASTGMAYYLGS